MSGQDTVDAAQDTIDGVLLWRKKKRRFVIFKVAEQCDHALSIGKKRRGGPPVAESVVTLLISLHGSDGATTALNDEVAMLQLNQLFQCCQTGDLLRFSKTATDNDGTTLLVRCSEVSVVTPKYWKHLQVQEALGQPPRTTKAQKWVTRNQEKQLREQQQQITPTPNTAESSSSRVMHTRVWEEALDIVSNQGVQPSYVELPSVCSSKLGDVSVDWDSMPEGTDPAAATGRGGRIPAQRAQKKRWQVESLWRVVSLLVDPAQPAVVVDFCGGSGHVGLPLAVLLPHCKVIVADINVESLEMVRVRATSAGLTNLETWAGEGLEHIESCFDLVYALSMLDLFTVCFICTLQVTLRHLMCNSTSALRCTLVARLRTWLSMHA